VKRVKRRKKLENRGTLAKSEYIVRKRRVVGRVKRTKGKCKRGGPGIVLPMQNSGRLTKQLTTCSWEVGREDALGKRRKFDGIENLDGEDYPNVSSGELTERKNPLKASQKEC